MEALLDACEEAIASAISRLLAGDIEAAPKDADACLFCPVLNCERRLRKRPRRTSCRGSTSPA